MKTPSFLDKFNDDKLDLDKEVVTGLVCCCSILVGTTVNALFSYMLQVVDGTQAFNLMSLLLLSFSVVLSCIGMVFSVKIINVRLEVKDKEDEHKTD